MTPNYAFWSVVDSSGHENVPGACDVKSATAILL